MYKSWFLVWPALALLAVAGLLGCRGAAVAVPTEAPQAAAVSQVSAGVGNGTISGNIFAPREITVPVGSTVTWAITSDEVHTVTFPPQKAAPPDGPPPLWPATVQAGATAQFDGGALVNSGIIFPDSQVNVTFPEAGTFSYICALHPGMQGVVTVVESGEAYTTASEAAATAKEESEAVLAPVEELRQERSADFVQTPQANGTTLWNVPVGALTNTPVGPLEILEYFPTELKIKAGDTVRWTATAPHTVTFLSGQEMPMPPNGDPLQFQRPSLQIVTPDRVSITPAHSPLGRALPPSFS